MNKDKIKELLTLKKELTGYASIDRPHEMNSTFMEKHPIIPNMSIHNVAKLISRPYKDNVSLDCLDLKITYDELFNNSKIISKSFKELGIKKGDIISVAMPNFYQAVAVFFAANRIGAAVTFINPASSKEEIKHYLNTFESKLFINYDKSREYNEEIKKGTKLEQVITLNKEDLNSKTFADSKHKIVGYDNFISFNDLQVISDYYKNFVYTLYGSKENALILFTSGSTGNPKSVVLTNENVLAAEIYAMNTSHTENITGPKTLTAVPFSYPYGLITSALTSILWGKESILAPDISKDTIPYYYNKKPNIVFGSPALLDLTINNVAKNQDLSFVTHFVSGGDFLTPQHARRGEKFFESHGAYNVEIGNGFGNAETVSIGSTPVGVPLRQETVGKILVGSNPMIVNPDTMDERKIGEEGLLCIAGKHVFKEYYNNPELTNAQKFTKNGRDYYMTGALGFIDEQGYFNITGRQSRFYINSSLNKIYCDNVQNIIANYPVVKDCAVVKVPDKDLLYVNKAYIVLNDGVEQSDEMINKMRDSFLVPTTTSIGGKVQLKDFEIPTYIEFVNELPRRQGTNKINYQVLEDDAKNKLATEKVLIKK